MKTTLLFFSFMLSFASFSQTRVIADLEPGGGSPIITADNNGRIVELNGKLYFTASFDDGQGNDFGIELIETDGTASGTVVAADVWVGTSSSVPQDLFKINSNLLCFRANNGTDGQEFYTFDGNNLVQFDIRAGSGNSSPSYFTSFTNSNSEDKLILSANGGSSIGGELYEYDIVQEQVSLIQDFIPGGGSLAPFFNFNYSSANLILFEGQDSSLDTELYSYDGMAISLLSDINPTGSSFPRHFYEFEGETYFQARDADGTELWKTNGTDSGTVQIVDINPSGASTPSDFIEYNGMLYFTANDGNGRELWRTDGTNSGTERINVDPTTTTGSQPSDFILAGNRLFFVANRTVTGRELFFISPTGSVGLAANINPGTASSSPSDLVEYNGKLYFGADGGSSLSVGRELWSYDLATSSFGLVADIFTGNGNSNPKPLIVYDDELVFIADGVGIGRELHAYQDPTLSINENNVSETRLFPNPTYHTFSILNNNNLKTIEIYNNIGQIVKTMKVSESNSYQVDDLTSGLYFVKVINNTASFNSIKLIVK